MAHFYGKLQGSRGAASRLGGKKSGLQTVAASYAGAVSVSLYVDDKGNDCAQISLMPWKGHGVTRVLYDGRVDGDA